MYMISKMLFQYVLQNFNHFVFFKNLMQFILLVIQKHLMCNPNHMFSMVDEYMNINETMAQMK